VAAIDIGIRHDDDLVIPRLFNIEIFGTDPCPESRDQRAKLGRSEHSVEPCALDVQDFTAQRQDCLVFAIARLLGGPAGGIALDDEQFGFRRVPFLAIGKLARQGRNIQCALTPRQIARLTCGFAGDGGLNNLTDNLLCLIWMFFEPLSEFFGDDTLYDRPYLG
jgi:hypothetical protein